MATVTVTDSRSSINTDPLRNFRFQVKFDNPHLSSVSPQFGFMSVDGLSVTTDVISYRQGGHNAQPLTAGVLTLTGFKKMGELRVGDGVIDPYGQHSHVTGVYPQGVRPVYKVTLQDGSSTEACHQHLWEIQTRGMVAPRVVNTLELKDRVERGQFVRIPQMEPFNYGASSELPIDPYVLGVLLAEGNLTSKSVKFTQDPRHTDLIGRVSRSLPSGHWLNSFGAGGREHQITTGQEDCSRGRNLVLNALRELGLMGCSSDEKFIPVQYLRASVEDRRALLQGIFDGDGSISPTGRIRYSSCARQLRDDVRELVYSLGGRCTTRTQTGIWYTSPTQKERKAARDAYCISSVRIPENPFYMSAKAERFKGDGTQFHRKVVAVEYLRDEEVQCISVSADSHLYVTDDFIPTHNTTTQKMPGQSDFAPITLAKGVAATKDDAGMLSWLNDIFVAVQGTGSNNGSTDFRSTVTIYLLEHPATTAQVAVKAAWRIYRAWPTSVAFGSLDAGANGVLMSQLSLAHEGWDMKLAPGAGNSVAGPGNSTGF